MNKVRGTLVLIFLLVGIGLNAQTFNNPGGTQNTCSGNFFDSGGAIGGYSSSENQTTTFCSDNGGAIIINFATFSLESGFDDLEIFDGATVGDPAFAGSPFTGTISPGVVTSTGTCITFRFISDGSVTDAGWSSSITCTAAATEYNNPGGVLNICTGNFTDTAGSAGDYGVNENITTTICSDNGDPVNVAFTSFDTEAGFDMLNVFNGATIAATPYPGSPFSGTTSPGTIVSSGTCLTFQFVSDGNVVEGGWTSSVSCGSSPIVIENPGGTVLGCNGTFFDIGGSFGNYENNENVTTTICPSIAGECLSVNFTSFDLENNFDDLTIFDGSSTAGTNLGTFTGTQSPNNITATTDCLTFVFSSDVSATRPGWSADLSCNTCGVTVCTGSTPVCAPLIPDACTDACDLGALSAPTSCPTGGAISNVFCLNNVGATGENPYSSLIGCEDGGNMPNPSADVWYSFVATANVTTINIDGLLNPSLAVYEGSTCTTMIGRGCDNGTGNLSLEINPTNPGVTYFLQMSGGDITDVGDFELEIVSTWDCTNCLNSSILTATPSPVNGQYQPGQVIEFCFTVNSWNTTANNWLHSVVPIPSGGWVAGSLTPTTIPPSCDSNGSWDWYNTITGSNGNSINPGTVGPGFAFDSSEGGPLDGNPGNNFGDAGIPADCPFGVTWTYCWTLEVADINDVGDCLANDPAYDLKITVETYGDGETGSWTVESCVDDPITESFITTACCLAPTSVVDATPCIGQSTGEITVTGEGIGPFDYEWVDNTNTSFQTANGIAGSNQATGLAGGTYTISVTDTDNGCIRITTITIVEDTPPSVTINPTSADICPGSSTTLTATGSSGTGAGYIYLWEQPDATTVAAAAIPASQIGTYTVTITDSGGCTSSEEAIVGTFAPFVVAVTTVETSGSANNDGILCAGDFATLDAGTFVSYVWSSALTDTNQTISVDGPGTYTVTVTDVNGCTGTGEAIISNTALPTPTIIITETSGLLDDDGTICDGDAATLDAGTFTAYSWTGGAVTQTILVTTPGLYEVTVTDANNCQGIISTTIVVEPIPTPTITVTETSGTIDDDGIICTGDIAVLDAGSFAFYAWSDALASATQTLSVNAGGTYTVSVTDGNGCIGTAEFIVIENAVPTPTVAIIETSGSANDDGILCAGDFATLDAGTFVSYVWSSAPTDTNQTISVDGPATYTVTVTDINGCEATAEATISNTSLPTSTITITETSALIDNDGTICDGDVAMLDAGVFIAYLWSSGPTTQTISVTAPGLYEVTFTDANGCQGVASTTIVVEPLPTPVITVAETSGTTDDDGTICAGDIAVLDAGLFASYLWSDVLASNTQAISVNTGGTYTVSVTDGNGCIGTAEFVITENPLPLPTVAITETSGTANDDGIICIGEFAMLDAGIFTSYVWSSAPTDTNQTISVDGPGTYTVTVTDANGCEATAEAVINNTPPPAPVITVTETSGTLDDDGIICDGDDAILDAGVFTAYAWSTGPVTRTITVTTPGLYTVTVTDATNCQGTVSTTIVVDPVPVPVITATETSGTIDDDGIICTGDAAVLDAGIFATYLWSDALGSTTQTITITTGGDYTVSVTDGNGCIGTAVFTVIENPLPAPPTMTITETSGTSNDDGILCQGDDAVLSPGIFDTYLWSDVPASTTPTLTVTDAGDYTVTITDTNGCVGTASATIVVNPFAIPSITISETSGNIDDDGILCDGDDAILDAGVFTAYSWFTGEITQTITVTTPGLYTVTVTASNGCQGTTMVMITVNPLAIPTITATETSGLIDDDGTICTGDVAVLDAGTFAGYLWSDALGSTTQTITVTTGGDYTVSVTDGNGCTGTAVFTIIENPLPTPSIAISETSGTANDDGILCDGDAADLDAGVFDSYLWSDVLNSTSQVLTVTTTGDYTVTVTDVNGCEATSTVTITITPGAIPDISIIETSGNTPDDGTLCTGDDAILDAGAFTAFLWSTGAITQTITVNTANTYTVSVTDANGCQGTDEVIIIVNPLPIPTITATETSGLVDDDGTICTGDGAVLDAGTFASYLWSDAMSSITQTITVLTGGDYTVTVTDGNGCQESATITIIENPLPIPVIAIIETSGSANNDGTLCEGDAAILDAGTFASYIWSDDLSSLTQTITVTAAGDYTVSVTDANGCESTATVTISTTPAAIPVIIITETSGNNPDDGILCIGDDAELDAGVFTAYLWSTGEITQTITVSTPNTYTVTVTDANSCQGTADVLITVNPLPTPVITATETSGTTDDDGEICTGDVAVLDAGIYASYSWSDAANSTTQTITVDVGGDYTVTVTDGNGCQESATITIIENPLPTPSIDISETSGTINDDGILCDGDDAVLDAGTFVSYLWSDIGGSITQTITVTAAGDYTVTVTDINGCESTATVTIVVTPAAIPNITIIETSGNNPDDGIICEGDDAVLDAGTFTSFAWSTGEITQTVTVDAANIYTVTVTDANGCQGTHMVTIVVNPLPVIVITIAETSGTTDDDGIICTGDLAVLDAGTFASYLWSDALASTTQTITVTAGGDYTVSVTDGNGCIGSETFTIIENPLPSPVIATIETSGNTNDDGIICTGDNVVLDPGTFDTYLWSDAGGSISSTITVTTAGDYTVTVTDANGCVGTSTVTIIELSIPTPVIIATETSGNLDDDGILCEGDAAVLDAGTFTSYSWSNGEITQTIIVTTAGDYTVTVTDFNGCNGIDVITIDVNPLPIPAIVVTETSGNTDDDGIICVGDPAVLDAGTYASYLWSDAANSTTQTITITAGGDYTVIVTDGNGCEGSSMITIIENPLPTPSITVTETSGTTNDDGIICEGDDALLDAGNFVSYVWSTGAVTQTIIVTTSGDYSVIVTDANGCEGTSTVTISAIPLPTPVIATLETSGTVVNDGVLCAGDEAILDPGLYTSYSWSTSETTATITVTLPGNYTVTVIDAAGCQGTGIVTIEVNPLPAPIVTVTETSGIVDNDGIICEGDMATLNVGLFSGGYLWSTGATTQTIDVTDNSDYTVTVTDGNGCQASVVANIIVNPLPTPAIAVVETSGNTDNDGVLCEGDIATLNAGSFATYLWSTGAITQTIDVTTSETFTVTVTDVNGCSSEDDVTITVAPLPTPVITIIETSGNIDNDGTICQGDVAVLDPGVYDSYLWSDAAASITQTLSVTAPGIYTVIVTDANGCENIATTIISVNPLPTPIMVITETSGLTDDDGIICVGDNVTLGVGLFGSYLWADGELTQLITVTTAGDYTVTVTDGNGCEATATATIVVNPLPIPMIIVTETSGNTANDGILCEGDAATLDAGIFNLYQWSTGESTQTVSVNASGTYTVTATDANGCNATDQVTITVNPSPVLTDPNIIVCSNEATVYDLTQHDLTIGFGTITWYDENPATIGVAIVDPTTVDLMITPNLWAELVDGNNCSETIDVSLTLNTPPTANITGVLSYCAGESTTLSATQGLGLTYEWSDTPATTTFDLVVTAPDNYTVIITDANNCTATATVTVVELPLPTATIAADNADACEGDIITFTITGTPSAQVTYDDASIAPVPVFLDPITGTASITVVTGNTDATVALVSITDGNCSQALTDAATTPVSLLSDAGTDGALTICGNGDANTTLDLMTGLSGTPETGGAWTDDNATGVDLTDSANVDFNGIAAGDYEFTYTITGIIPCPNASAIVTVTVVDAPTVTVDGTTCALDILTYSADVTALVGTISTDFGIIIDNTGGSYTITDIPTNTTATITVTDGIGCETSATAFNDCPCPVLNDPINDGDMSMCQGTAVPELSVTVDAGLSANWYDAAVGGTLLAGFSTTYTATGVLLGDHFFYAEVIDPVSGCTGNRVEVMLTLNTNPTADPASLTVCDDGDNNVGFTLFTLTDADVTVLAGQIGMTVTYYVLPGDALTDNNPLGTTYTNVLFDFQTIYARVEDANGCFATSTIDLMVNPLPPVTVELTETSGAANNDDEICEGDIANLNVSIAGLTYEWSEASATTQDIDVTPLVTTTYTVTVTGLNTCTTVVETIVIVNPLPTATISFIETSGTTADDGIICEGDDVVLAVAEAGVNYSWSTGQLSQVITVTPLVTTDYTVTTTNIEGCTSADTVTVVVNPLPIPVITVTETSGTTDDDGILCEGDNAVLDAGLFDSYLWSDAAASTTSTITVIAAGTYSVTTTDANGCVGTGEITIIVNPLPNEMITITETSGTTSDDGILCDGDVAVLDAGVFMEYIWSTGETTQTITVSTAGTYSVTCVGFNGCQASTSVDIIYNPLPTPVIIVTDASGTTADDGILCEGDAAVLDAGIADAYLWSDVLGSTTQMITVTTTGTYTVTTTDANGCEGTAEIDITVNPLPAPVVAVTEISGVADDDGILCEGDAAVLDAGLFDTYLWSDAGASITQTITVTVAGTYDVTTTDVNGCVGTASITIFVNPLPTETITITETSGLIDDDGIICDGDNAILDAGPGFVSYLWSDGGASTTQTLTVNVTGTYTVICMNANGCEATASVDIISTPLPIPVIIATDASGTIANDGILCIGDAAVLDAGVFDTYLWSDLAGSVTATITVTDAGLYTVTVTDANTCQATAEFEVFVNLLPTPAILVTDISGIAVDDAIICEGDNATLDAGVFASYLWSDALGFTQTVVTTPLVTTTYTVTVTDGNGCEATTETTVTVNPLPFTTIAITDNSGIALNDGILCAGDMATLTAEAGFTYLWSEGAQITQSIDVTATGAYTVSITDGNGCESIITTVIVANPLPTPVIAVTEISGTTANDGILCIGDDAVLNAGLFSAYEWSIGSAATATVTVNVAGTYTVTVTDANGCVGTAETTITTNPLPAPAVAISETSGHTNDDGLLCAGDVATLDAGIFDSYLWSLGNANTQTITVNTTGNYTVTVTDVNGCEATSIVSISINPIPVPAITGDFEFCEGTSTVLTATPGYVGYAWSPSETSASLAVTQPGDYTVTVTDENGCTGEATVTVTDVPGPTPFIVGDDVICAGTTTTIDVGAGYAAYNWSEGTVTQTATVSAGIYIVTVTDNNGCFGVTSFNVAEEPGATILIEEPDRLTCNIQIIRLDASATINGAIFEWTTTNGIIDSGASTATPIVSQPGVYTVTVFSSALGCPTSADVTVIANPFTITDIYVSIDSLICYGDSTAIITIDSIEGGVEPYFYQIDTSAFTGQTIYPGLMAGEYVLTVMDAEGCEYTETVTVAQPPLVTLDLFPIDTTIHLGDSVQLEAFVNPLIELADTIWTQTSWLSCTDCLDPMAAPLQTTMYELIVVDTNGCEAIDTSLVRVENQENIFIPNGFTPNNDGANDVFMIYGGVGVTRVKSFVIFDRWGEQMFSKNNFQPNSPQHGWDGTLNGKPMRPAVFVYSAEVEFDNGRTVIFKGDVTLISSAK